MSSDEEERDNHASIHQYPGDGRLDKSTPYTIVWTSLPVISWLLPFIGHTGITDSNGIIYDFAGPYYVSKGDMAFGKPLKTVQLKVDPSRAAEWDECVMRGNQVYCKRMHNLCCDNCHSHVAQVLNNFQYKGKSSHNMMTVWWMTIASSSYLGARHFFQTYFCFLCILMIVGACYLTSAAAK